MADIATSALAKPKNKWSYLSVESTVVSIEKQYIF